MEAFQRLDAVAAPMPVPNVDTDQIIPARFLRRARAAGFGQYLFNDLRFDEEGRERPDFVLNQGPYRSARILIAERNFACGSSREHAVYALWDHGFLAVIAPSFGDIFYGNSFKNGFLPIVLPAEQVAALRAQVEAKPGAHVIVDLVKQEVTAPDGTRYRFEIDAFRRDLLLKGVDELDFTLSQDAAIENYERRIGGETPWI